MTEQDAIKKAIRHFECMKNDAVVVLDSGFGTHKGESDLIYRKRKMYAELAIKALEKQIARKPITYNDTNRADCPICKATVRAIKEPFGNWCSICGQKLDWSEEE